MNTIPARDLRAIASGKRALDIHRKWSRITVAQLALYICVCFVLLLQTSNVLWDPKVKATTMILGALGIWRYSWWFTHVTRSEIFCRKVFPEIRSSAQATWDAWWRPQRAHFMMTTFKERRDTTELIPQSICREVRETGIPTTLWLGSGDSYDEEIMMQYLRQHARDLPLELVMLRQNLSGKRMAIGLVLSAM
ncbi:MAG: glycosyltransferase Alg8, partial [Candidatus Azotimanducaceae bacterium]